MSKPRPATARDAPPTRLREGRIPDDLERTEGDVGKPRDVESDDEWEDFDPAARGESEAWWDAFVDDEEPEPDLGDWLDVEPDLD